MFSFTKAELMKMNSSWSQYLFIGIPFFLLFFSIFTTSFAQSNQFVSLFFTVVYNQWPIFFLPTGLALACGININLEKRSGSYKGVLSNQVPLSKVWYAKIASVVTYQGISSLLVIIITILGAFITNKAFPNIPQAILTTLLITVAALPLIPLYLIMSQYIGTTITFILNVIGSIGSATLGLKPYFWILPWGNMLRIPAEMVGVHPNGTPMETFNGILNFHISAIALIVSILYFIILSWLSSQLFKRKVRI